MRIHLLRFMRCSFLLFGLLPANGQAQETAHKELLSIIEARLEQLGGDTASYFILDEVRNFCQDDYNCLQRSYDVVLTKLEGEFKYFASLLVAREMASLAEKRKDIEAQAGAIGRLSAIYGFIGDRKMRVVYQEQLFDLYEQLGDTEKALQTKATILEGRVWYLMEAADVLPELKKILDQALENGYTGFANKLRIRIKYVCEEFGFHDELVEQVEALEEVSLSDPLRPSEYHIAFHAASGRGDLLLKEKKYDQAKNHYLKAYDVFQFAETSHHDIWLQVYALFRLAKLEWERGNNKEAKKFLDEAYAIADKTEMHDRAIMYLQLKTEIAETEKNYEDALRFTKEIIFRQAKLDSIAEGFDMEKYTIQTQREYLEAEKKNQAMALELSRNNLKYSIAIAVLATMLAVGLFIGFYRQRQRKKELAAQNTLIQQQAEQLKQLDAAKSRFFANISHELRTPLTLILGPVKTLLKGQHTPQKQGQLLNMVLQSSEQLQQLVNEILDLRKMEMGKMELHEAPTELFSFFSRNAAQFESLAASEGMVFSYETNIRPDVTAAIDREKYRQVLHNLLSNAFKFIPDGGKVTAKTSLDGNILTLEVADTGAGIHPDDLPHVFDRFYQTSRPDKTAQGGTGIGLALCKEYAQLFGGKMEVESQLGKGSVFRAVFPVTLSESTAEAEAESFKSVPVFQPPATPENAVSAKPAGDTRPTILVVEDNPELQAYIRFILAEKYHVITAGNGKEALELLRDEERGMRDDTRDSLIPHPSSLIPDLILSDLMMPVMDGYQFLEKLKSDDAARHIPVIMLTARAEAKGRLKALRIGVDDYLTKPFDEEELLVRIENLLANQAVRKVAAAEEQPAAEAPEMSQPDREWLENFETYIRDNLSNDALTISFLAQEFAMSESTLFRQVTRLTGLSPKQYLQEVRLSQARHLLENRAYRSVSRVATAAGFGNARTFTRSFKERFGKTPSEYLND